VTAEEHVLIEEAYKEALVDEFMKAALEEAQISFREGGIPIGAVLVRDGKIIGRSHNRRVQDNNPILHAEIACLQNAGRIKDYQDTVLYSTLMPCYFCGGAILQFGIPKVVSGETEHGIGSRDFLISRGVEVIDLDLEECKQIMRDFIARFPDLWAEDCGVL